MIWYRLFLRFLSSYIVYFVNILLLSLSVLTQAQKIQDTLCSMSNLYTVVRSKLHFDGFWFLQVVKQRIHLQPLYLHLHLHLHLHLYLIFLISRLYVFYYIEQLQSLKTFWCIDHRLNPSFYHILMLYFRFSFF
jgi:hypothetical protein